MNEFDILKTIKTHYVKQASDNEFYDDIDLMHKEAARRSTNIQACILRSDIGYFEW